MDSRYSRATHLPQARRELAHAGPARRTHARAAALILLLYALLLAGFAHADDGSGIARVEAVRTDWNAQTPPADGWVEVTLPDDWSRRWPDFDGVVWYRITWNQPSPATETGLYIENLCMAGEIAVNGAVVARDPSLTEPLSHLWNLPRYFHLSGPLLRAGENVLLVRVSGFAAYEPGLGSVNFGPTAVMHQAFVNAEWVRLGIPLVCLAIGFTLGCFFLTLWLMRRQETAYGWFAAQQFVWISGQSTLVTGTTFPFTSTDALEKVQLCCLLIACMSNFMFVLRYCERRWPWRERLAWALAAVDLGWILLAPHAVMRSTLDAAALHTMIMACVCATAFVYLAWQRGGRADQRILSLASLLAVLADMHDLLALSRVIQTSTYYATYCEQIAVLAMAAVLSWNFIRGQRRIEGFNVELKRNVADARAELATTLQRQHDLELVHARLGERLNLAHDLHDGLGSMLIGDIAALEQAPEHVSSRDMLDSLRQLRDDLRLIIDTASAQHYGEHSLGALLGPLRHRTTRLFEVHDIDARWQVGQLDDVHLTTTQSLDVLRILQELLANVLKHSGASRVSVEIVRDAGMLRFEVRDNGVGISDRETGISGTGMRSIRARAHRLGAELVIGSEPGATAVRLHMPWPVSI